MFNHKASLSFRKATKTTLTGAFAFGLLGWIGASPARGSNLVTVEGKDYAIIFQYTSFNNISTILKSQPWWGNSTAAKAFATSCWYSACKSSSGYVIGRSSRMKIMEGLRLEHGKLRKIKEFSTMPPPGESIGATHTWRRIQSFPQEISAEAMASILRQILAH